jgi:hypothetical protein
VWWWGQCCLRNPKDFSGSSLVPLKVLDALDDMRTIWRVAQDTYDLNACFPRFKRNQIICQIGWNRKQKPCHQFSCELLLGEFGVAFLVETKKC